MAERPFNLALRFTLEIAGLVALAMWGWSAQPGPLRWVFTIGAPVVAAVLWGTFRVQELHSKNPPPVLVLGWVRLLLEAAYFGAAVAGFWAADHHAAAYALGAIVIFHYVISYDRVVRLLSG